MNDEAVYRTALATPGLLKMSGDKRGDGGDVVYLKQQQKGLNCLSDWG